MRMEERREFIRIKRNSNKNSKKGRKEGKKGTMERKRSESLK